MVHLPAVFLLSIALNDQILADDSSQEFLEFSLEELFELEDVVVTAQKRAEFSQNVPISITSFDADLIKGFGFGRIWDIAAQTPSLDIKNAYGNANPIITIRGVGVNDVNSNNNPSVGIYVDEVYFGSSTMLGFPLFDLERIEVLTGPQGTLYGRNTTSGAINFTTVRPDFDYNAAYFDFSTGSYNSVELNGAWNRILIDNTLAARLSFFGGDSEGHIDNIGLAGGEAYLTQNAEGDYVGLNPDGTTYPDTAVDNYGGLDIWGWRASFTWDPSSTLNFFLSFHGNKNNSEGWLKDFQPVGNPNFIGQPGFSFYRSTVDAERFCDEYTNNASSSETGCVGGVGFRADNDPYTVSVDTLSTIDNSNVGVVFHANVDFDGFYISSVTSWEELERELTDDLDNQPQRLVAQRFDDEIRQITQELRFTSFEVKQYSWIVGLFYSKDEIDALKFIDMPITGRSSAQTAYIQESTSTSVFTQAEWQLTDPLRFVLGLRYTNEDKTYDGKTDDLVPYSNLDDDPVIASYLTGTTVPFTAFEQYEELKYEDLSGKIGISYTFNDDMMSYVSVSKGFKSGGFDGSIIFSADTFASFDSEIVKVAEVGWKSMFMNRSMQLNAVAYAYIYEDMQLQKRQPDGDVVLTNAGEANINGLTMEYRWRPLAHMDVHIGYGYTKAKLTSFDGIQEDIDRFEGNELPNSPENSLNGLFRYEWTSWLTGMNFAVMIDFSYQDSTYKTLDNIKLMQSGSYALFNARASLMSKDATWEVYFWGKNLGNKVYITETTDTINIGAGYGVFYGMPRTLGLGISYHFGVI